MRSLLATLLLTTSFISLSTANSFGQPVTGNNPSVDNSLASGFSEPKVAAEILSPLNLPAAGLLETNDAGLSSNLWEGFSYAPWQALLSSLPGRQSSPTLRELVAHALLVRTPLPAPDADELGTHSTQDQSLLRARAVAGYANAETLGLFLAAQSDRAKSPALTALGHDIAFSGNAARACTAELKQAPAWQLYCNMQNGKTAETQLALDLIRDTGESSGLSAETITLLDAASSGNANVTLPEKLSVLDVRLIGLVPEIALDKPAANTLATRAKEEVLAARGGAAAPAAAEFLVQNGYSGANELIAAYKKAPFTIAEKQDSNAANRLKGANLRAYLWQKYEDAAAVSANNSADNNASNNAASIRLFNDFVANGGAASLIGTRGQIWLPLLNSIAPQVEHLWAAPSVVALALAQDKRDIAGDWYDATTDVTETMPAAKGWIARLYPLALAGGLPGIDASDLGAWIETATSLPDDARLPLFDILTLLEARGVIVAPDIWEKIDAAPVAAATSTIDTGQIELLKKAAADGRQGEVILRSAILGATDISTTPVPVRAAIIRALTSVGLNQAADKLTVETLLYLLFPSAV